MRVLTALCVMATTPAYSDVTVLSGRMQVEVTGIEGQTFQAVATPTGEVAPMRPVNEPMLHLSCFLIPDLSVISVQESVWALQGGADRYCAAQFGGGFEAVLEVSIPVTGEPVRSATGTCIPADQQTGG